MADDVLFEVDASQIVAKLHFAGLQATRKGYHDGAFFVNTGMKDDDPMGEPDKIGKARFDLTNKSGTYQFGWVKPITYELDDTIDGLLQDLDTLRSYVLGNGGKSLTDQNAEDDAKKKIKDIEPLKQNIQKACKAKNIEYNEDLDKDIKNIDDLKKTVQETLANDSNAKGGFQESFSKAKAKAQEFLTNYMETFAGKDNVNITDSSIGVMQVKNGLKGPNDASLVKMFEIQPASAQDKGKAEAEARNNPKNAVKTFCFYVQYKLLVEK